jgi:hypothetical protein
MMQQTVPVNRTAVGVMALACLTVALAIEPWTADSSNFALWQSALGRVGVVMGALWLALPGRNQEGASWNLSPKFLGGVLVAMILTIRIPPRLLIPGAIVLGVILLVLRPRPKRRPRSGR